MLWSSRLTLSVSAGRTAEAWTSWSSIRWVKRSREQSSSCCWDHVLAWCWGWGFVCIKGIWVSLRARRSAWICRSLFTQPFFKAACVWLSALETGNRIQERLEQKRKQFCQKLAGGEILIYPLSEALCSLTLASPPGRPRVPALSGASSPAPESAPTTAALPVVTEPKFLLCRW